MKQTICFLKKLTSAEVGATKAHVGGYIRLSNDFDFVSFFRQQGQNNNGVVEIIFDAINRNNGKCVKGLRFAYFENSNNERRIPNLASLFKENDVDAGDVVKLESRQNNNEVEFYISFFKNRDVTTSATNIYYVEYEEEPMLKNGYSDNLPLQQIFYGAPGTGKSNTIKREVDEKGLPNIRTTFHPDSDYSTFVGAYKPTSVVVPVTTIIGKEQVLVPNAQPEKKIVYEFVPQAFLKAYTGAWKNQDSPFFLIIEEINRGNCAQIFGDLFQLLDRDENTKRSVYPISPDEDIMKFLQTDSKFGFASLTDEQKAAIPAKVLSGEEMRLPQNLHIWATMNTSDQSLFPIDSAFKRRWDWEFVPIANANKNWKIKVNGLHYDWWEFLVKINEEIGKATSSEDKKLGYFFCKAKDDKGIIDAKTFVSKVIFYLWNDVFKDFADESATLFKAADGESLSFNDFYRTEGNTTAANEFAVQQFLNNLKIDGVVPDDDNVVEDESNDNVSKKHKKIRSVQFPDGTEYSINNGLTHFAVYLESLKKMGLDRVYPLIANMKYNRNNCPMMSKEELPGIIEAGYSYHQEDGYFIVKGAIDDTLISILNKLNTELDLGIVINTYE